MTDIELKIKEFALENAIKFEGKANQGAVIGKLMAMDPALKQQMKDIAPKIGKIIAEIQMLSVEEQKAELLSLNPEFDKEQEAKKKANKESRSDLPPLRNAVDGEVVMRIAPEPSKYTHIGHAVSFLINYMYSKRHEGKCILRFDDTNPEKESQEYVDAIYSDVIDYLDLKIDDTVYASDRISSWIELADKLIKEKKAYTCTCPSENISTCRREMKACEHKEQSIDEIKKTWKDMKEGKNEEAVLRLNIDMEHKNAVMRDPVIFRVINTPHFRQGEKFKVWPMYDFECAVIEAELGVTHVLRSNEFTSRIELQDHIRQMCGYPSEKNPTIKQYARFEIVDALTQGREIRAKIESGEYTGWSDPRLVTLKALQRRGIVKESYFELAKTIGMSNTNSQISFDLIALINRRILDATAKRFFFLSEPVAVDIAGAPTREISLDMHPDKDLGVRNLKATSNYLIDKKDFDLIKKGEIVRLIDNLNFKDSTYVSDNYEDFKGKGELIIEFLPADVSQQVKTKVLMPDNTYVEGIAEVGIADLKVGEIIQFQRFGFARLDEILEDGTRVFWYSHE